jgi:hypothetical protein
MIKKVNTEEAVGMMVAHDMTKVVPGEFKGARFKKGHIIADEDIPELLAMGKEHIYVIELEKDELHEDEAASRLALATVGEGLSYDVPREGKINPSARYRGLVRINIPLLNEINSEGDIVIATIHDYMVCEPQTPVAGMRVIPLTIRAERIEWVEQLCAREGKVLRMVPLLERKTGIVVTGSEVYKGRIKDAFTDIVERKVKALGSTVIFKTIVPDEIELIAKAVKQAIAEGSEVVFVCGGMSVDPDDVTRMGIAEAGASTIFYGVPLLPGSMTLYAKLEGKSIMGVPACVLHSPATAFDVLLPRVLAGEQITREDASKLGHGGLCHYCAECHYPVCPLGK